MSVVAWAMLDGVVPVMSPCKTSTICISGSFTMSIVSRTWKKLIVCAVWFAASMNVEHVRL